MSIKRVKTKISVSSLVVASALTQPTYLAVEQDKKQIDEIEVIQVTSRLRK